MVGYHSDKDFKNMVCVGMIPNCPVNLDDIKNANTIFGSDVPSLKGDNRNITCVVLPINLGAPVWISKASMYLRITFVFYTDFYMHLISTSVDSYAIVG